MAYWHECWSALQPILSTRQPHTNGLPPKGSDHPESQHEAMLVRCGLNAVSARCIVDRCTLADFLGIPPRLRLEYFPFLSERALNVLSAIVDSDDVVLARPPVDEPPPHLQHDEFVPLARPPVQPPPQQDEFEAWPSDEASHRQHELDALRSRRLGYSGTTGQTCASIPRPLGCAALSISLATP